MKRNAILALLLLVACGTPQEQCIDRNTRDLRIVDGLIAETQGNIDRGYALKEITIRQDQWGLCRPRPVKGQSPEPPVPCMVETAFTVERPKAIDLAEEARKLESLRIKRTELAKSAEPVIAQCKAEYPE